MFKVAKYGRIRPVASKFVSDSEERNDYLNYNRSVTISLEEVIRFNENVSIPFYGLTLGYLASIK